MSTKNKRKKAALGDYEYTLAPTTVYGQGRKLPDLSAYNRVIGPVPTIDRSFPDISKIEGKPIVAQVNNLNTPTIAGTRPIVKSYTPSFLDRYGLNNGDLLATGIQVAGNLGSSLINNAMVNKLKFTPLHTMTVAEAPVKFNTTYDINPQVDNLREQIESTERAAVDNSASSRNAFSRILGTRFRGIGAYNELYGHKLNQETNMLNTDAQNRQGVSSRNASRLQQNIARDILYNTQGKDNLDNLKFNLKGQIWSNFVNQLAGSLIGTYNRGQQRISDSNSLGFLLASNPNSANLFMNNNSLIDRIFRTARRMQGIYG